MTLYEVISRIEQVASDQPAINTIVRGDVYALNAMTDTKYGTFVWTQGEHSGSIDDDLRTYSFVLYYVDRLTANKGNEVEIESIGCDVLENILADLSDTLSVAGWRLTAFTQRFLDDCAGVFAQVQISAPRTTMCAERRAEHNLLTLEGWKLVEADGKYVLVRI